MVALLPIDAETPRRLVLNPALTDVEFEPLCAASDWFCLERTREGEILMSKSQQKMERWIENGASLGWLIDPYEKKVYIYETGAETSVATEPALRGRGPLESFTLTSKNSGAAMRFDLFGGVRP